MHSKVEAKLLLLANLSRAARSKTIGGYEKSRYHLALKYFMCDRHLRMSRAIERHARASPRRNGGTRVYMRMRAYASASARGGISLDAAGNLDLQQRFIS